MNRESLTRLGGVSAAVAGSFSATINLLYFLLLRSTGTIPWPVGPLLTLSGIIITLLYAAGLLGLYALARRRSTAGMLGLGLAGLSLLAALSPWLFAVVYVLYQVIFIGGDTITSPVVVFPEGAVDLAGSALLAGGILLVGLAAAGSRALDGWTFLPFLLALLTVLPLLSWAGFRVGLEFPGWIYWSLVLFRGLLWILLGVVLWRRSPQAGVTTPESPVPG